jgi:hypothetical protein
MTRKVSLWIVIALVGALAATTAAVIVLATHDEGDGRNAVATAPGNGSPHAWNGEQNEAQDQWRMPMMRDAREGWGYRDEAPILPWALFALATGTAVGLLVAWRPWSRTPATVSAGPSGGPSGTTTGGADTVAGTPEVTEVTAVDTPVAAETSAAAQAPPQAPVATETPAQDEPQAEATAEAPPQI